MHMPQKNTRDRRAVLYGVLDVAFAGLYLFVSIALVPSRSMMLQSITVALGLLFAGGGVGMLSNTGKGRVVASVACVLMLAACALALVMLVASAAYLHGIYGGVGQAGAAISLVAAALVIEFLGLLPAFQLAYLRSVRRAARG